MPVRHALASLDALRQPTRLAIFRGLIASEPDGLPASAIAEKIDYHSRHTLWSHLNALVRVGLVRSTRQGRSTIYRADVGAIKGLVGFLVNDCCSGHPELCDLAGTAVVFDDDAIVHLLKTAIKREGSQLAFAKHHRINRSYLNGVLRRKRPVSDAVVEALGLQKVYVAE